MCIMQPGMVDVRQSSREESASEQLVRTIGTPYCKRVLRARCMHRDALGSSRMRCVAHQACAPHATKPHFHGVLSVSIVYGQILRVYLLESWGPAHLNAGTRNAHYRAVEKASPFISARHLREWLQTRIDSAVSQCLWLCQRLCWRTHTKQHILFNILRP
jgi:hypothetical protein